MAYLFLPKLDHAEAQLGRVSMPGCLPTDADRLTPLEWSVVRVARKDGLGSLRPRGGFTDFWRLLLKRPNPQLADARLEALRRIAVLSWRYGYTVPSHEVRALIAAGFTPGQYETLVDGINAAKPIPPRTVIA